MQVESGSAQLSLRSSSLLPRCPLLPLPLILDRPTDLARSSSTPFCLTSLHLQASLQRNREERRWEGQREAQRGEREREDRTRRRLASSHNSARLSSGGEALSAAAAAAADRKSYVFHSTSSSVQIGERTRSKSVVVLVTPCPPT